MKSDLRKGLLFITAGIIGLLLIPYLYGINRGFSMMGQMGMMRGMGSKRGILELIGTAISCNGIYCVCIKDQIEGEKMRRILNTIRRQTV